ncbi:hypothetical protein DW083_20955 [Parabacteroides sp. AF48-14]|uniref:hypothetical protein n=1 Tax=Parabacteroides sp. AF48-14 TaxID=2292052 RepID=UPI000EFF5B52|nr:hypothetical protein [Parabacteroides sp. AF48-14]RHO65380.1 hypothetical protein DW083_20955 [Parabacteroides sp. AF48-14]
MILANTKYRILHYIDSKGISKSSFYESTGIKRGLLDKDKMNSTVTDVFIAKILAVYTDLNADWLLTGRGSMLKSNGSSVNNQSIKGDGNNMIGGNGAISVDDKDSQQSSLIIAEYNERLKKQELYIQSLLEEQKSLHQQISKLIDKLK